MRLALVLLAALLGGAAAQPAAVAHIAAVDPTAKLALDLLPSPTFTIQSFSGDGAPRTASDEKLRAYCKVLHARTPGVCFKATHEGAFARSLCPGQCAPSTAAAATRTLLAANASGELKPCSQTADTSDLCAFFIEQAEGACATAGFLSVYMRVECRKSCGFCTSNAPTEASKAPVVEPPPEPVCAKAPDAGSACPFFFTNLANPCSLATAGDAWIANYTQTQCQTSCGICQSSQQPAEPALASPLPEPSPSPQPAMPSPTPASGASDCVDLSTASFSCADVVKQELCGQPWAAGWCAKSCGYCDPEQPAASPAAEQPAPASPAPEEQSAASPVAEQPASASPTPEEQPATPSPATEQPAPASPPATEQPAPASPVSEEQPDPASPAAEEPTPSPPAVEQPAPASPGAEEQPAASPATEEQPITSPVAEEQPAPASPATEEQPAPTAPAEELSPLPSPSTPAAEEPAPQPAESPATQEPAPASPPTQQPASPSPAVPSRPVPAGSSGGSYGAPSRPGGYGASPAPSVPSASPSPAPPSFEPRLTTAAVCQALACLTLPPSGDRLLTLPGVASCPPTACRLPAVECPSGCSAHGACHVFAGACVCFEGYTGLDCASCAVGFEHAASGACVQTVEAQETAAPIRPLFGGAEAATGRHLMAVSDDSASITAAESQMVGSTATERLALAVPSGWIAGVVVAGAIGMVAVAALLALRARPSGGPLPL